MCQCVYFCTNTVTVCRPIGYGSIRRGQRPAHPPTTRRPQPTTPAVVPHKLLRRTPVPEEIKRLPARRQEGVVQGAVRRWDAHSRLSRWTERGAFPVTPGPVKDGFCSCICGFDASFITSNLLRGRHCSLHVIRCLRTAIVTSRGLLGTCLTFPLDPPRAKPDRADKLSKEQRSGP